MGIAKKVVAERPVEEVFALPKIESDEDFRRLLVGENIDDEILEAQFLRRKSFYDQKEVELRKYGIEFSLAWCDKSGKGDFYFRVEGTETEPGGLPRVRRTYRLHETEQRELVLLNLERMLEKNELLERMVSQVLDWQKKFNSVQICEVRRAGLSSNGQGALRLYDTIVYPEPDKRSCWYECETDTHGQTALKDFLAANALRVKMRDYIDELPKAAAVRMSVDHFGNFRIYSDNPSLKLNGQSFRCTKGGVEVATKLIQESCAKANISL